MTSLLFKEFDPKSKKNEQFAIDLSHALDLDPNAVSTLVDALPVLAASATKVETERVTGPLFEQTGLGLLDLEHIANVARFFLSQFDDDRLSADTDEVWADDLETQGLIDETTRPRFAQFLTAVRAIYPRYRRASRIDTYKVGVLPYLHSCGTTVELRGVFGKAYEWGNDLGDYVPELVTAVPVISVRIGLDSGTPRQIVFQATPENMKLLVTSFQAALRDADTLAQHDHPILRR